MDEDIHSHKCPNCGHIWTHARPVGATDLAYQLAHTCPCGTVQYYRHFVGTERADHLHALLTLFLEGVR